MPKAGRPKMRPIIPTLATRMAAALLAAAMLFAPIADAAAKNDKANNGANAGANKGGGKPEKADVSSPGAGNDRQGDADLEDVIAESVIDASARAIMGDYFEANPQPVEALPPGIAKNVQRGKPLPPGIAKRSLPSDLSGRLRERNPSIGDVVDAVIVGDDVAIVDAASGVVVEILKDIVRAR